MLSSADALRATSADRRAALDAHAAAVIADPAKAMGGMFHNWVARGGQLVDTALHRGSFHKADLTGATLERVKAFGARIRESRIPVGGIEGADEMKPEIGVSRQRQASWKNQRIVAESRGEITREVDL
jgi:hypothetical protein